MRSSDGRTAALGGLKTYLSELQTQHEQIAQDIAAVERSISLLSRGTTGPADQDQGESTLGYAGLGPQGAVEQFLQANPGRAFRPSEMAKRLRKLGFTVKTPKNMATQITTALARTVEKRLAVAEMVDGRKAYRLMAAGESPSTDES